jgi:hypothetical protein
MGNLSFLAFCFDKETREHYRREIDKLTQEAEEEIRQAERHLDEPTNG